jgi:hypothetical protein
MDRGKFARKGRPYIRRPACRFDPWLSCAGSDELAPEVEHGRVLRESSS